jgi:hypothetical protein
MCTVVPVLRVIGFVFLVLAILACALGFIAPFWIRLPLGESMTSTELVLDNEDGAVQTPVPAGVDGGLQQTSPISTERQQWTTTTPSPGEVTSATESSAASGILNSISSILHDGTYWGLWSMCHSNLTCTCFWQNDFKMEKEFPDWLKAVQGLFGLGLVVLLIALCTASFHVCCCHCCRESFAVATVIGSLTAAGLILVTLALLVYAGFAAVTLNVEIFGSRVFEFAFFVPVGGVALALIAAILFLIDGRRAPSDNDGDGEETAKMV